MTTNGAPENAAQGVQNADALITQYLQIRDHVTVQSRKFDEYLKPYHQQMEAIENKLLALLSEQGSQNIKTNNGTAYKSVLLTTRMEDRSAFLKYVLEEVAQNGDCAMLMATPKKDEVRDYIDQHKASPPGIGIEYITRINVRRS